MKSKQKKQKSKTPIKKAYNDMKMLGNIALSLVIGGVTAIVGVNVLQSFRNTLVNAENVSSFATNVTNNALSSTSNFTAQIPLISTIAALSVVIALLIGSFAYMRKDN